MGHFVRNFVTFKLLQNNNDNLSLFTIKVFEWQCFEELDMSSQKFAQGADLETLFCQLGTKWRKESAEVGKGFLFRALVQKLHFSTCIYEREIRSSPVSGINPGLLPEWIHSVPYCSGGMNSSFPQCKTAFNLYWRMPQHICRNAQSK